MNLLIDAHLDDKRFDLLDDLGRLGFWQLNVKPAGEVNKGRRDHEEDEEEGKTKEELYEDAANALIVSDEWDENLWIWGTQMIGRTALGDQHAIISPARSTAVRINIHLHRQTFYDAPPDELYDTEDDWED